MFRAVPPADNLFGQMTVQMVDDRGVAISFLAFGRSGEWKFAYRDASMNLDFQFSAERNNNRNEDWRPVEPFWRVAVIPWSLANALQAHPPLHPDRFEAQVRSNISEALLHWPLDPTVNTVAATTVTFVDVTPNETLKTCLAALRAKGRNPQ